ncbi:Histone deacetylase phd1 [Taphrina deformans PYCC 5710]|uniref:Histone deacetylase n=1 Tax=Taphrina deformans (strain PYCC 5710 / ATCC 11124 / CBS 356.35 / IMI 108563 / JCM 9778 / NBRC 8474) TaxID=1097556 RepID=R4X8H6_TAPDE|nr:Histone deacetylase phd1 [Taphrina deformans PYCC 5710]|eukprot:CCG81903.1 Histone deacetylase phd1 [Taphrina deformans PYCC 5710]
MLGYCYSQALELASDQLPSNIGRSSMVHHLIAAYGLLSHKNIVVLKTLPANKAELTAYHDAAFVDILLSSEQFLQLSDEILLQYGLVEDCPIFPALSNYVCEVAGASLRAAKALSSDTSTFQIVINWDGGRHHAKRGAASGFCYIADAVLAIQQLRKKFERVIYIDLDIHHGDGVESAFVHSDKVFTLSLHRFDSGFFPQTGSEDEQGKGKGFGYAMNLPLQEGLSDSALLTIVTEIVKPLLKCYHAAGYNTAVVIQCGVDSLALDPTREWNLSIDGYCKAIASIQASIHAFNFVALYLGGGGYDKALASRCYTAITATLLGHHLSEQIPEHSLWHEYTSTNHDLSVHNSIRGLKDANEAVLPSLIARSHTRLASLTFSPKS